MLQLLKAMRRTLGKPSGFTGSDGYWRDRYRAQGNSGSGSYGRLAEFKAQVINQFVSRHDIQSVIEWGCGDGNQLTLAAYPKYVGVDISPDAVQRCSQRFRDDPNKRFMLTSHARERFVTAELALSLDVIYHLVEDAVFDQYMTELTRSATRWLGVYSSDHDAPGPAEHVRHRQFSQWIAEHAPRWQLVESIPNSYPYDPAKPEQTSWADFKFYGCADAN